MFFVVYENRCGGTEKNTTKTRRLRGGPGRATFRGGIAGVVAAATRSEIVRARAVESTWNTTAAAAADDGDGHRSTAAAAARAYPWQRDRPARGVYPCPGR